MPDSSPHTDYQRIKEIFHDALDVETGRRMDFVAQHCITTADRREVESLIQASADAGSFLSDVSVVDLVHDSFDRAEAKTWIGRSIGKYRIERELARGGMGIVFLARREDFAQTVALKVIKRGMDSDAILERFFRERRILANLNHPYIAKFLDGGTTEDGLPYFAMEYVEGVSIAEFCTGRSETETLELFRKVASAVSFAHQKLIVHRDLKPSNILVGSDGEPKLLDFGIAKLLEDTDSSETQVHQRMLTPAYASPEQLRGDLVGTASDVYSLGKILSELLSGRPRLSSVTARDDTQQKVRRRIVNGELESIVAMATRDEIDRRYSSVEAMSEDVQRYIDDMPVLARVDSFFYRAVKFLRRNRTASLLVAAVALSLAAGMTATIWEMQQARRARELSEQRFESLRRLSDSFVTEIHGAIQNLPGSLPARQLLLRRATEQLDTLNDESGGDRSLRAELAQAYFNLASLPGMALSEKSEILQKSAGIYQELINEQPANTDIRERLALTRLELSDTAKVSGSLNDAVRFSEEARNALESLAAEEPDNAGHKKNLFNAVGTLVTQYRLKGDFQRSLDLSRRGLQLATELGRADGDDPEVRMLICHGHLQIGTGLTSVGDYQSAISELREALDGYNAEAERRPNDTSITYYRWAAHRRLADALRSEGNIRSALSEARLALDLMEGLLHGSPGDMGYHRNSAISHLLVGRILLSNGRTSEAIPHFRRALDLSEQVLSADPQYLESRIDLAVAAGNLGNALFLSGRKAESLSQLRRSVSVYREIARIDIENAQKERDYAETAGWLADDLASTDKTSSDEFRRLSSSLWHDLAVNGKLTAADASKTAQRAFGTSR